MNFEQVADSLKFCTGHRCCMESNEDWNIEMNFLASSRFAEVSVLDIDVAWSRM